MTDHSAVAVHEPPATARERLAHWIDEASEMLPAQGPITVFIHHNTLHHFEHLTFDDGVRAGAKVFGCHPWLPEERYRQLLAQGRIRKSDLDAVLRDDLGARADQPLCLPGTRHALRLAMLEHPVRTGPAEELRWFVAETDALQSCLSHVPAEVRERLAAETRHEIMRELSGSAAAPRNSFRALLGDVLQHLGTARSDDWTTADWEMLTVQALWRICRQGLHGVSDAPADNAAPLRHRDALLQATGCDTDVLVNDVLIRFCAAFSDQGVADWTLPRRADGFWASFCALYQQVGAADAWLRTLPQELARLRASGADPLAAIEDSLHILGIPESEWPQYLVETLLALRGWAGMLRQNEVRPDRVAHAPPPGTVVEYLAARLVLERLATTYAARRELGFRDALAQLRRHLRDRAPRPNQRGVMQRAFDLFQVAQLMGWGPVALRQLTHAHWASLLQEIEDFPELERRRLFHWAFERRFRNLTLDAVALHARRGLHKPARPRWQAVFCLDEREESIRRHLEEVAPDAETFGVAGFFCAAMYYKGAADAHFVPLCPVVIRPQHYVQENVASTLLDEHQQRTKARRVVGKVSHRLHTASRSFAGGAMLTMALGVLASVPLVARVLFPQVAAWFRRQAGRLIAPPPQTQLQLERTEPEPGPAAGHVGFTVAEMANISERMLRDIGLIDGFARLVVLVGHGSGSQNNPHKSAYDCGACGGNAGAPNARAVAAMLNDGRVRDILAERGVRIPQDTAFVGGFHNTCNDTTPFFDVERLSEPHQAEFAEFLQKLDEACDRNAHERCRRFMSAPLNLSFTAARQHVAERAEDLAQTRPELGHATNAICYVGRRSRTRGLFFDRRCFLTSYDPTQDDAHSAILTRILQAAVPVCGGISLEYYFSHIDPPGWGCGTKLPHNVSALLGVMDGPASDLRTGLPWQMTEIHEPVRLLIICETTPEALLGVMERNPPIRQMCVNGWVQLATHAPDSDVIHVLRQDRFERYQPEAQTLPSAPTSTDWYRGWRDHLEFAEILPPQNGR